MVKLMGNALALKAVSNELQIFMKLVIKQNIYILGIFLSE